MFRRHMFKTSPIHIIALLALAVSACGQTDSSSRSSSHSTDTSTSQLSGKLNITGSSTIAPLAAELAQKLESKNPQLRINVQTGGSYRGLADIRQSVSDIGMISRKLKDDEKDILPHLLAKDGIGIIVHKSNPITALTVSEIKSIYLNNITNWKSLNGTDKKITVIHKAEGRSTLEVFLHFFKLKNTQIKPDIIIGDNEQGIKLVSRNPNAIAYVSIGTAEYNIKAGTTIKILPLNGIEATTEKLASGEFPLSRELNLITSHTPSPLAQAYIAFTKTPEAEKIIKDFGFVPVK